MGYFSRLDSSVRLDEPPPLPAAQEPKVKPVPAQPAATGSAAPAADLVTTPAPSPAADPAEKTAAAPAPTPEKASTPVVVKLDAPTPADDTAARQAHEEV